MPALLVLARAQLRRHRLSLVLLALLAALTGSTVVAAASVARRTATADRRLAEVTNTDDVRTLVFGGDLASTRAIGGPVLEFPEVSDGRLAVGGVGRLDVPGVVYISIVSGPEDWGDDVLSPVVSSGRLPDPDDPHEVVINEAVLRRGPTDVHIGDRIGMQLLTAEEFARFDASKPLEGTGGDLEVEIVGTVRFPGSADDLPPLFGSPALARSGLPGIGVLGADLVQLRPGADVDEFTDRVNSTGEQVERPAALGDFPPISVSSTKQQVSASTHTTTGVLTNGLLAIAGVALLIGLIAVVQAALRQHASGREVERIESAIGASRFTRVLARVLAAAPAAVFAGVLTAGAGLAVAPVDPPGQLRLAEPNPGWAPNLAFVAIGALATPIVLLAIVGLVSARGTRVRTRVVRESRLVSRLASIGGRPPGLLGLRFAFERSSGPDGVSARAAMAALGLGLGGVVAAAVFGTSMARLIDTPVRYGWPADLVISDAGPDVAARFETDKRFDLIVKSKGADVVVDGVGSTGVAQQPLRGTLEWELREGRPPATPDEIVLGTRIADELGKGVGDVVELTDRRDRKHELSVIGVGVVPNLGGGQLGRSVALTEAGLEKVAAAKPFPDLALGVRDGVPLDPLYTELTKSYEWQPSELPREVSNLEQIDRVPLAIAAFLLVLCLISLAHAISMVARRRTHDLATAESLGFTRGQCQRSMSVMALATAVIGVTAAIPLGLIVGRTLWRLVAEGAAVLSDAAQPWSVLVSLLPVTLAVALAIAAVATHLRLRGTTSEALRSE